MPDNSTFLIYYILPLTVVVLWYVRRHKKHHRSNVEIRSEAEATGQTDPASLHPVIDPIKCIGCAACVAACPETPEHKVLGLIHGKASLIAPTDCIGHGACYLACPVDAITLVFGTEKRGVDIPHVKPSFETNVPGIYIAGELGGMGLIRNAFEQGRQAIEHIHASLRAKRRDDQLDVLIVGAGPAGFAATLAAKQKDLSYKTIELEELGGAIAKFPRRKLVMTSPGKLPIVGKVRFRETSKENIIEFFKDTERETGIEICYNEQVETVGVDRDGFVIGTTKGSYRARRVLLAIGRRGAPRKLGVPGEELPKVAYRLVDPDQYRGKRVLVIGGGDSALEAACSLAEVPGVGVTLSYRSAAFTRAKRRNRELVAVAEQDGALRVLMNSNIRLIESGSVQVEQGSRQLKLKNDGIIICTGGTSPTPFLESIGIVVETKFGTA
jgi:thioredoxin reductase (NADPH)